MGLIFGKTLEKVHLNNVGLQTLKMADNHVYTIIWESLAISIDGNITIGRGQEARDLEFRTNKSKGVV